MQQVDRSETCPSRELSTKQVCGLSDHPGPCCPRVFSDYLPFPWMHFQEPRWRGTHAGSSSRWRSAWAGCWGSRGRPPLHGARPRGSESGCSRVCGRAPRPGRWAAARPSSSGSPRCPAAAPWRGAAAGGMPPQQPRTPRDRQTVTSSGRKRLLIPAGGGRQGRVRNAVATAPGWGRDTSRGQRVHPVVCLQTTGSKPSKTLREGSPDSSLMLPPPQGESGPCLSTQGRSPSHHPLSWGEIYFNLMCRSER